MASDDFSRHRAAIAEGELIGTRMGAARGAQVLGQKIAYLADRLDAMAADAHDNGANGNAYYHLAKELIKEIDNPGIERRLSAPNAVDLRAQVLEQGYRLSAERSLTQLATESTKQFKELARTRMRGYREQVARLSSADSAPVIEKLLDRKPRKP